MANATEWAVNGATTDGRADVSVDRETDVTIADADLATIREAMAIGQVSYDGDSWFAADAGYGYDEAEATMNKARAILARLSVPVTALDPKEPS
jgi:hypothetical protein